MRPAHACRTFRPLGWLLGALTAASLGTACERPVAPAAAAPAAEIVLTPVAGTTTQSAMIGTAVPVAPSLRVTDATGRPIVGAPVIFVPTRGGGRVTGDRTTTNDNGVATVGAWALGTVAGPQELWAVVRLSKADARAMFNATATPGAPASIRVVPAHASIAPGGTQLLTVNLHDLYGNLITSGVGASIVAASPAVASVTAAGLVTAGGVGVATITASFGGYFRPVRIAVGKRPLGATITSTSVGDGPFGLAISSADVAYVGRSSGISRFDLPGEVVTANIPALADATTDIAFLPNGSTAYVLQLGGRTMSIVDVATNSIRRSIHVWGDPYRLVASPDGAYVYATTASGDLVRINTATDSMSRLALGGWLGGLAFSGTQPVLFVVSQSGTIHEIDLATFTRTRSRVNSGSRQVLQNLAVSLDGSRLFVADESGDLQVVSTATLQRVATVHAGADAFDVVLSRDACQLYVARTGPSDVVVLDADTYAVVRTIPGSRPRRIAFDATGQLAMFTIESGRVTFVR